MVLEIFSALPYGNFLLAALIIATFIIAAKIIIMILGRVALHVTAKTRTTLDDKIVAAIRKPVYIAVILIGVLFSLDFLDFVDAYISTLQSIFTVAWILLGAYTATNLIKVIFSWYASEIASKTESRTDDIIMPIIRKIINVFVYVIALLIILGSFGVEITPLVAGLGVGGIAIALALQESLSNLFSGTFIISDRIIGVGDYIELENGPKGYVTEIGWRSTKIRTLPNNIVIIPNTKLANSIVTDYNSPEDEMSVVVPVGVSYDSDLKKVRQVTVEVAKEILQTVPGGVKEFEPFIRYNAFADSNINFSVILRVQKFVDQYQIVDEFIQALKEIYDKEKIEISYPVRKIVKY